MVPGNFEGAIVLLNILFFHIIGVLRYQHTPRLTIFQKKKKCFLLFQIDLIAIFHLKKLYEKRLILCKVTNEKCFFA